MENFKWIEEQVGELEEVITRKKARLKLYKYDNEYTKELKTTIEVLGDLIALLKKQAPIEKEHEYGGPYRCSVCGCVVNQYAKYCHYCGQRFKLKSYEGIEGWCPDK